MDGIVPVMRTHLLYEWGIGPFTSGEAARTAAGRCGRGASDKGVKPSSISIVKEELGESRRLMHNTTGGIEESERRTQIVEHLWEHSTHTGGLQGEAHTR